MRVYMTKFQDSPPLLAESGLRGLQQVASAILESRASPSNRIFAVALDAGQTQP